MPIFAYRCQSCGFEKDVLQKRADPPLVDCPACSRDTFARQLTAPAFQLKGSGWYVTDFRENGKGKPKPAESGEGAPGAPGAAPADSAPADSAPAESAPAKSAPAKSASEAAAGSGGTAATTSAPIASSAGAPGAGSTSGQAA